MTYPTRAAGVEDVIHDQHVLAANVLFINHAPIHFNAVGHDFLAVAPSDQRLDGADQPV